MVNLIMLMTADTIPVGITPTCPSPPWESIGCDHETGRIVSFYSYGTSFCIPDPCPIPQQIFRQLSALSSFAATRANIQAQLSGSGALDMSKSRQLVTLSLDYNKVSGPFNESWATYMPKLRWLGLSGNNITVSRGSAGRSVDLL